MKALLLALVLAVPCFGEMSVISGGKQYFTGYKRDKSQHDKAQYRHFPDWLGSSAGEPIPLELDPRPSTPIIIRSQQASDCWAQATAGAFGDVVSILDKASRDFSVQSVIDCSGMGSARGGGDLAFKTMYLAPKGAIYSVDYSYRGNDGRCQAGKPMHEQLEATGYVTGVSGGNFTIPDLQRAIMETRSLGVCGSAGSLQGGGWVTRNARGNTNHCYRAIGWLDGASHGKPPGIYFIFANSWGTSWGDKGFAYVFMGKDGIHMDGSVVTEAMFLTYKSACVPQPSADAGPDKNLVLAPNLVHSVKIGTAAQPNTSYKWAPAEGLDNPNVAQPIASPLKSTQYTVTTTTDCGKATSKVTVHVFNRKAVL